MGAPFTHRHSFEKRRRAESVGGFIVPLARRRRRYVEIYVCVRVYTRTYVEAGRVDERSYSTGMCHDEHSRPDLGSLVFFAPTPFRVASSPRSSSRRAILTRFRRLESGLSRKNVEYTHSERTRRKEIEGRRVIHRTLLANKTSHSCEKRIRVFLYSETLRSFSA